MKKIIIFSHEYPPCLGGVGTIALQIFEFFHKDRSSNIEVITSRRSNRANEQVFISKTPPKLWIFSYYFESKKKI